jgi:hypothetical protein
MAWIASQEGRGWPQNSNETDEIIDEFAKAAKPIKDELK